MVDLGALSSISGGFGQALGINGRGQVVGSFGPTADGNGAFLYSNGAMVDLNNPLTLPAGLLTSANAINDLGQIAATGYYSGFVEHAYLLVPLKSSLTILNPFAPYAANRQLPPTLDVPTVLNAPKAVRLAADGQSAVVLSYQSNSPAPVTFALSGGSSSSANIGSMAQFDPNYLAKPNPATGNTQSYQVQTPTYGPDASGTYTFLALLWAPNTMPAPGILVTDLIVSAQQGLASVKQSIELEPPPLLLVHGVWSSAAGAGFAPGSQGFYDWISSRYPHGFIYGVDYGIMLGTTNLNSVSFSDPRIQQIFSSNMTDALSGANGSGMAARTVDVVGHSMGGLVTRYFMSTGPPSPVQTLLSNPVHKLITIGTPHLGSNLAAELDRLQQNLPAARGLLDVPIFTAVWCVLGNCTLGDVLKGMQDQVDGATASLEPNSGQLQTLSLSNVFSAIVGTAPSSSFTERALNALIGAYAPGETLTSILNSETNDTIVPVLSQDPIQASDTAIIPNIVHTSLCSVIPISSWQCSDTGETASLAVWNQAYFWLTGGTGAAPTLSPAVDASRRPTPATTPTSSPLPVLDLTRYTQVAASNVTFSPVSGSTLATNSVTNITAASSTKTISELLLAQTAMDPTDTPLFYAMQSPFSVSFTPVRLGVTTFGAIAVFSDNTYAMTTLNYAFQPVSTPYALNLLNAPLAIMEVGESRIVQANALFPNGTINVTQAATYKAASGSTDVFTVSAGGTITANGNGVDEVRVSYGGVTSIAPIRVGSCNYALTPASQLVPYTGGTVTIQVTTQPGCSWTASGGSNWLPLAQASSVGSGVIILTALANSTGGTLSATVSVGDVTAFVAQPAVACSFSLSASQITAPAAGASGTITAASSCPAIVSSDQSWLMATTTGSSVQYVVTPNNGTTKRNATLTVGTVLVPVVQSALNRCDVEYNGNITVADVQLVINEALGAAWAGNDLNEDGVVNVVDVQIEINAALGLGCASN